MLTEPRQLRKPKLPREVRRQAIVDAATRLFAERGFRGVTTREIASAVGVTEPVLYEHFKTKRDLYDAIIDLSSKEGVAELERLLDGSAALPTDRDYFVKLATLFVDFVAQNPDFVRLLLHSSLERHVLADMTFERQVRLFYKLLSAHIDERIAAGAMRPCDSMIAARALVGMLYQYASYELVLGFRLLDMDRRQAVEGMVDIFLNGMVSK
jgi:AcrR family transcriptional regulator